MRQLERTNNAKINVAVPSNSGVVSGLSAMGKNYKIKVKVDQIQIRIGCPKSSDVSIDVEEVEGNALSAVHKCRTVGVDDKKPASDKTHMDKRNTTNVAIHTISKHFDHKDLTLELFNDGKSRMVLEKTRKRKDENRIENPDEDWMEKPQKRQRQVHQFVFVNFGMGKDAGVEVIQEALQLFGFLQADAEMEVLHWVPAGKRNRNLFSPIFKFVDEKTNQTFAEWTKCRAAAMHMWIRNIYMSNGLISDYEIVTKHSEDVPPALYQFFLHCLEKTKSERIPVWQMLLEGDKSRLCQLLHHFSPRTARDGFHGLPKKWKEEMKYYFSKALEIPFNFWSEDLNAVDKSTYHSVPV